MARRLLLLCERGGFAPMHQAATAAAAAVSTGWRVDLVLFHGALARFLDGRLDEVGSTDPATYRAALEEGRVVPVSEVLASARSGGAALYACSASLALLGREVADVSPRVDEIVGWPTILGWMAAADRVLSL